MSKRRIAFIASLSAIIVAGAAFFAFHLARPGTSSPQQASAAKVQASNVQHDDSTAPLADLHDLLDNYRKIIVLLADEKTMTPPELASADRVGQALFHDNLLRTSKIDDELAAIMKAPVGSRYPSLETLLNYIESGDGLYDADRLAFRETLNSLQRTVSQDQTLQAIKLHKRISEDIDALNEIENLYEKEMKQIFDRFETRGIELKRERWEDYVANLRKLYSREQILKDYGVILPYPEVAKAAEKEKEAQIFGTELPPKTVALSFDDGPHDVYTNEIAAILKQYGVTAVFFQVGRNLGSIGPDGKEKLNDAHVAISRKLEAAGHVLGNHSFTHALLSKESGDALNAEIRQTDRLLKDVDPARQPLFRFPYGAHNKEGMAILSSMGLHSVLWNVDSLDWADPIPSSIADRVLRTLDKEQRGIILFHDIHESTIKALPMVLDRLVADGYHFAAWDGQSFKPIKNDAVATPEKVAVTSGYQNSWAVVIGINDYAKWPKLQYAANDAKSMQDILINRFSFAPDHVLTLTDGEATRNNILALFHDRLAEGAVKRDDRIFVFFAGHGATVKLSSGRNLGYIIPVDSDPDHFSSDAIPMTDLQNIAENLVAKHVLFVMDACYSGLGLMRGGGTQQYLRENAHRIGRQMLTAGGADQMVADSGPNGHSIFTWTLLQGLSGKADLNGDGVITATELAAYVAPAVSSVSQQTPAFGSLPGSEGGEFVFELPAESEFLNAQSAQLSSDAIALNTKLDEKRKESDSTAPVVVKNLQGGDQKIALPKLVNASARQLAQHANDQGLQLYREKQYEQAEAAFTEALKQRPDFGLAANNLGFVYFKQEKYAEAARWFENTLHIDPSRAVAYLNLGDARFHLGENDKAKQAYSTYLELTPNGSGASHAKEQLAVLAAK